MNSFDLRQARELTLRLTGSDRPCRTVAPQQGEYLKFRVAIRNEAPRAEEPLGEIGSWEMAMEWVYGFCGADAAFVVDGNGFVVACAGPEPSEGFEGIGAELCYHLEQLDRLDARSSRIRAANLDYPQRYIFAFRAPVDLEMNEEFVIAVFSGNRLDRHTKEVVLDRICALGPSL